VYISTFGEWNGDTKIWLRNSSGVALAYNDDPVSSNNYYSMISTNLNPGNYYIEVRQFEDAPLSTYQLLLETDAADQWEPADNATNGATVMVSGSISAHSLHVTNDVDWFRFSVDKPSTALLVNDSLNPDPSDKFSKTKISLFNAAGTPLAENQGGNRYGFSAIVATNLDTGIYYLKVEGYLLTNACPDYTLSLDLFEKQTAVDTVSADAGGITFEWQGEASFMYLMQYASNLAASNAWMTATSVEGRMGSNIWTDDGTHTTPGPGAAGKRFYRVVTE
jgi:hypothetical protein